LKIALPRLKTVHAPKTSSPEMKAEGLSHYANYHRKNILQEEFRICKWLEKAEICFEGVNCALGHGCPREAGTQDEPPAAPMGSAGRAGALLFFLVAGTVAADQIFPTSGDHTRSFARSLGRH
jgi:hypothetical protein